MFSTQWTGLVFSDLAARDGAMLIAHQPRLVLANDRPHFGLYRGLEVSTACPAPRLVWCATEPAGVPNRNTALEGFIRTAYKSSANFGPYRLFSRTLK